MIKFYIRKIGLRKQFWSVIRAEIDFDSPQYAVAVEQARTKSQQTMAASQSGAHRTLITKYNMQLMGIIAEIACKGYLEKVVRDNSLSDLWKVIRYDDIRTDDFRSSKNEYDLKMSRVDNAGEEIYVESRSSITHDRSLQDGLENYDIIGSYTSKAKGWEGTNDIYLRPLYEYVDYSAGNYSRDNFEVLLKERRIILYLVAGCTLKEFSLNGIVKSMNQGTTKYSALPIMKSTDIIAFQTTISKLLNRR